MTQTFTSDEGGKLGFLGRLRHIALAAAPQTDDARDREFLRDMAVLGSLFFLAVVTAYLATVNWTLPFPRDKTGLVVGRDFLNLWMYGRAALDSEPLRFYDVATYNAELSKLLGPGYPGQNFPNPPTALLVMVPFAWLPFYPALAAWFAASFAAIALTARRLLPEARVLGVALISPAALLCLMSGQSSLLTTAALIGACLCWDRRPVLAGLLIGLMTVKPQLGILIPFALMASHRWKVFIVAAATAALLVALSVLVLGYEIWIAYVTQALPLQRAVLADASGVAMPFHATIFMNLRGVLGNDAASAVQIAAALAAIVAVVWAFGFRRNANPLMLCALLLACTQAASPYMSTYDLLPLTLMAFALLACGRLDGIGRRLVQLVFWAPALQLLFGSVQMPGPGFIAPAFAIYLLTQLRRDAAYARLHVPV